MKLTAIIPFLLIGLAIVGPAIFFLIFLQYFRLTRLAFSRCITCPERKQRATVELIGRFGELGAYRDVRSCSLLREEMGVTCDKACLLADEVLETPFVSARKQQAIE